MGGHLDPRPWPVPVVGLVSSTGGLDAVCRVLEGLPASFPAALVVLRHASPAAPDVLAKMLRPHTDLTIETARDGDAVLSGRILVAPPAHHTLLTPDGHVALIVSGERPPYRPSADLLFTSMALSAGRYAVAVVLSGHGNDGATGATAVHRFGGTVIASDRATSTVFSMPSATIHRDLIVDHVTAVDGIPAVLETTIAALDHDRRAAPVLQEHYPQDQGAASPTG